MIISATEWQQNVVPTTNPFFNRNLILSFNDFGCVFHTKTLKTTPNRWNYIRKSFGFVPHIICNVTSISSQQNQVFITFEIFLTLFIISKQLEIHFGLMHGFSLFLKEIISFKRNNENNNKKTQIISGVSMAFDYQFLHFATLKLVQLKNISFKNVQRVLVDFHFPNAQISVYNHLEHFNLVVVYFKWRQCKLEMKCAMLANVFFYFALRLFAQRYPN